MMYLGVAASVVKILKPIFAYIRDFIVPDGGQRDTEYPNFGSVEATLDNYQRVSSIIFPLGQ